MLALGLMIGWLAQSDGTGVAELGQTAPDFTVRVIGGDGFTLSAHDGPVVINQWASWCIPCREEIPQISAFAEAHPEVTVIGVAVEDTETAATAFTNEIGASYDMALGDGSFEKAYPRLGLPVTYVIDDSGIVKNVFNGILDAAVLEELVFG